MSATISVANDVVHKLDKFKEDASNVTGKEKPSYSEVIRLLMQGRAARKEACE